MSQNFHRHATRRERKKKSGKTKARGFVPPFCILGLLSG